MILSADRDDCCAETWKMVSGDAKSGGYSCGSGSRRHDEPMESDFYDTWRRTGQRQ